MPIRDEEMVHLSEEEIKKGKKDMKLPEFFFGHTTEQAKQVLKEYDNYVMKLASWASMWTGVDKNDLVQEGYIGLARAVRDFEENRGAAFKTIVVYKIKDAIKEFIATQSRNVAIPRYIKEVVKFSDTLRNLVSRATGKEISEYTTSMDVWQAAKKVHIEGAMMQEITNTLSGLVNLAQRSNTTVPQLLERAEILPTKTVGVEEGHAISENLVVEENLLEKIHQSDIVGYIEELIPEEDFKLLCDRYINGFTIEEVGNNFGITAESVSVREQKILTKLRKHEDKILERKTVEGFAGTHQRRRRSVSVGAICTRFGKTKEVAGAD